MKGLSRDQLEEEKSRALRELKSPRFAKDTARQTDPAKPMDPHSSEVKEPTMQQIEDYLALIEKVSAKVNPRP